MITIDLSKQHVLDVDPKVTPQITFTESLERAEGATIFFILEGVKETILDLSQGLDFLKVL